MSVNPTTATTDALMAASTDAITREVADVAGTGPRERSPSPAARGPGGRRSSASVSLTRRPVRPRRRGAAWIFARPGVGGRSIFWLELWLPEWRRSGVAPCRRRARGSNSIGGLKSSATRRPGVAQKGRAAVRQPLNSAGLAERPRHGPEPRAQIQTRTARNPHDTIIYTR